MSVQPLRRWVWIGPMSILLITAVWWILITRGGIAGSAAWFLYPIVAPALGIATLITAAVSLLRKRTSLVRAFPALMVGAIALYVLTWRGLNYPFEFPTSPEGVQPPAYIRVPADVPMRVLWGGNSLKTNYHASIPEARWAYDLGVEPHPDWQRLPNISLEDYGCWGVEIVAPAAGKVLVARDGGPDHSPGTPWRRAYPPDLGNHVVIEMEGGTVLTVAHLQRGSVAVTPGSAIREGKVIGRCGNSGNSFAPHVHIDHRPALPSPDRRLPFLRSLPLYFRDHAGDAMPEGGFVRDADGRRTWTGAVIAHRPVSPPAPTLEADIPTR